MSAARASRAGPSRRSLKGMWSRCPRARRIGSRKFPSRSTTTSSRSTIKEGSPVKRILVTFLVLGLCAGWSQERKGKKGRGGAAPNTLTAEEQQQGFELLFDGKSLDKFNVSPGQEKIFLVVDGAIKTDTSGAGSTLLTKEDYANFILKAEFRASPDVNSGLMLRNPRP